MLTRRFDYYNNNGHLGEVASHEGSTKFWQMNNQSIIQSLDFSIICHQKTQKKYSVGYFVREIFGNP